MHNIDPMGDTAPVKQMSSADFRKSYASLTEPVEVTSYGRVIMTCYPAGAELPSLPPSNLTSPDPKVDDAPQRMTIRPVKASPRGALTSTEKRIIDPVQKAQAEREMWSQLQAKMYPSKGSRER